MKESSFSITRICMKILFIPSEILAWRHQWLALHVSKTKLKTKHGFVIFKVGLYESKYFECVVRNRWFLRRDDHGIFRTFVSVKLTNLRIYFRGGGAFVSEIKYLSLHMCLCLWGRDKNSSILSFLWFSWY